MLTHTLSLLSKLDLKIEEKKQTKQQQPKITQRFQDYQTLCVYCLLVLPDYVGKLPNHNTLSHILEEQNTIFLKKWVSTIL